ncbi:MAG: hypothetical protein HDR85_07835 [Bacteroides sp.]|nr:hypothetical protein [Bacteroides sp.]
MANWEPIGWVEVESSNLPPRKFTKVYLEIKLIGDRPMYRAKLDQFNYATVVKITSRSCNAQFTWDGVIYYINVPYWD